ncbi:glycosyltransferase family 2 protein [Clostridium perfringens]|nr:glycosyltransferase family 2 protein [Clostridium perfringens]
MEKVSFLMTVYNAEESISEVIDNILNQTYCNFELIIVNDGSTDNSFNIINSYAKKDKRIVFINRNKNKGRVYSLNEGLNKCTTEYIFINDSDDVSTINRVEIIMKYYNSFSNNYKEQIGIISGSGILKNNIDNSEYKYIFKRGLFKGNKNGIVSKLKLYTTNPFIHSAIMYKKSALDKIGGFTKEVTSSIDYFTIVKISKYFYVYGIQDIVVTRFITGNNFFMRKDITEKNEENIKKIKIWIKDEIRFGRIYFLFSNFISKLFELKNNLKI